MESIKKTWVKVSLTVAAILAVLILLWVFLQFIFPHFTKPFRPTYEKLDLAPVLNKPKLEPEDYDTLFSQTGLGQAAIDDLMAMGAAGADQIRRTQDAFFDTPVEAPCSPLGITTREHRFLKENGAFRSVVPLAPLREGDIMVSLSTHTAGWKHGHSGLVVDPEQGITLESVVLGSLSSQVNVEHWSTYSTMAILRPKADDVTRHEVVQFALEHLDEIPYSLLSGAFGDKFQPVNGSHSAHCGYLPWYAWMAFGYDLDGDGGRIVAPGDFLLSDKVEIVQIFGIDPASFR